MLSEYNAAFVNIKTNLMKKVLLQLKENVSKFLIFNKPKVISMITIKLTKTVLENQIIWIYPKALEINLVKNCVSLKQIILIFLNHPKVIYWMIIPKIRSNFLCLIKFPKIMKKFKQMILYSNSMTIPNYSIIQKYLDKTSFKKIIQDKNHL